MNKRIRKDVETSCDYTLPDYMGDIKKLLSSRARVLPSGKYISGDTLEVTGAVEYELLYADAENRLTAVMASSDYALSVPTDAERYVGCACDTVVSNLSVRVTGPRRLSMKAQLRGAFTLTEEGVPEVVGDVFSSGKEPEVETRVINSERYIYSEELEREYAEEAERLEGLAGEDVEVIASSGEIKILETRPVEGGVEIRGELIILAIIKTPEQPPFRIVKTIPFTETVSIGTSSDGAAAALGRVRSVSVDIGEEGDDKTVLVSAAVELSAYVVDNEALEVATDAYLTESLTAASYEELDYTTHLASHEGEIRAEGVVSGEALGTDGLHSIVWLSCEVRDFSAEREENRAKIGGNIQFSAIACEINADRSIGYIPVRATVPFEDYVNLTSHTFDNVELLATHGEPTCEYVIDGAELLLRGVVPYRVREVSRASVRRLSECSATGEEVARRPSVITVYYPTANDTLFSVAKRYATTVARLSLDNPSVEAAMAGGDLSAVGKLIIK